MSKVKLCLEQKSIGKTNALTEGISLALIIALINPEFLLQHAHHVLLKPSPFVSSATAAYPSV